MFMRRARLVLVLGIAGAIMRVDASVLAEPSEKTQPRSGVGAWLREPDERFARLLDPERTPPGAAEELNALERELRATTASADATYKGVLARLGRRAARLGPDEDQARHQLLEATWRALSHALPLQRIFRVLDRAQALAARVDGRGPLAPRIWGLVAQALDEMAIPYSRRVELERLAFGYPLRHDGEWGFEMEPYISRCVAAASARVDPSAIEACLAIYGGCFMADEDFCLDEIFTREAAWQPRGDGD